MKINFVNKGVAVNYPLLSHVVSTFPFFYDFSNAFLFFAIAISPFVKRETFSSNNSSRERRLTNSTGLKKGTLLLDNFHFRRDVISDKLKWSIYIRKRKKKAEI